MASSREWLRAVLWGREGWTGQWDSLHSRKDGDQGCWHSAGDGCKAVKGVKPTEKPGVRACKVKGGRTRPQLCGLLNSDT